METKNRNLHKAKKEKNDEFYTQISDIEKELKHYKEHFKGKIIFCNCDDPESSHFWKYFEMYFLHLGIKKLISTHYESDKKSYKLEIIGDYNEDGKIDHLDIIKTELKQNGDFRSEESIEILKECDIVVTNPPFSLFREYIAQLIEYDKKFLVIGNLNAITYKEIFSLIKDNKLWIGVGFNLSMVYKSPFENTLPDNMKFCERKGYDSKTHIKVPAICWYTNLEHKKRNEIIDTGFSYKGNEDKYPKYDNYDAINVDKVKFLPMDYDGVMGVPITFLDKLNPKQFKVIKFRKGDDEKDLSVKGRTPYFRILIQKRK